MLRDVPVEAGYKLLDRRWVLYDVLGHGGMAVVYRGKHLRMGHDVAIKCLDPVLARRDPQFVERFVKEARAAARVNDPCVVQVHDVAEASGLHFMAMQFVDGENARQRVERKGLLAVGEAITIAKGACQGMAAAHRAGLVHRDIKPDNILISTTGEVKLADLGLAKMADGESAMTLAGVTMGTPRYMPPEQFADATSVGSAADVYSLGATLYFLLTGKDGIVGNSVPEVMKIVCEGGFPRVSASRPDVPPDLDALIARCVSVNTAARPADGKQMLQALEAFDCGPKYSLADDEAEPTLMSVPLVSPPPEGTLLQIQQTLMVGGNAAGMSGAAQAAAVAGPPAQPVGVGGKATQVRTAAEIADERLQERKRLLTSRVGMSKKRRWVVPFVSSLVLLAGVAAAGHWKYPESLGRFGVAPLPWPWPGDPAPLVQADNSSDESGVSSGGEIVDVDLPGGDPEALDTAGDTLPGPTPEPVAVDPIVVDLESPRPIEGVVVTRDDRLNLTGRADVGEASSLLFEVDGAASEHPLDAEGRFDISMKVTAGGRHAVALSVDESPKIAFTVAHDAVAPVVKIDAPIESARRTNAASIDVTVSVDDEHPGAVSIDGTVVEPDGAGRFVLAGYSLPVDGLYTIVIEALDLAQNSTSEELVIERDTVAPDHIAILPAPGSRLPAAAQVEWALTFNDKPDSVRIGDVSLVIDALEARATLTVPDQEGLWKPILSVFDDIGNVRKTTLEYTLVGALPGEAPKGFSVVDAVPRAGEPHQADGKAAKAGWAWRVKHNRTGLTFLRVEAGSFRMGSPETATPELRDDVPQREVSLTAAFYLAETEITREQFARGGGAGVPEGADERLLPATAISFKDADAFCSDNGLQLPTEAQFEYACRAGTTTPWSSGNSINDASANIAGEGDEFADNLIMPVGSFSANGWGFRDMHGNAAEFCRDKFESKYYETAPDVDPENKSESSFYILRGGSYLSLPDDARSAFREKCHPLTTKVNNGFRPMLLIPQP